MHDNENVLVSFITVTFNSAELIENCINSVLSGFDNENHEFIIIDNNSSDNTSRILNSFGEKIHLIENKLNVGFSKACNQGFEVSKGQFLFFLNPDTIYVNKTIDCLLDTIKSDSSTGIVAPRIKNFDGSFEQNVSYRYPGKKRYTLKLFADLPGDICSVLGAAFLIKRDIFKKLSGFDENFFLYGEDQDICLRVRKLGYTIKLCENSSVYHAGGNSEKNTSKSKLELKKLKAELIFQNKHYPRHIRLKIRMWQIIYTVKKLILGLLILNNTSFTSNFSKLKLLFSFRNHDL
jgi:GT2 family glycosyltransferase